MHGWFCPIGLIHLIGRKCLHFENKTRMAFSKFTQSICINHCTMCLQRDRQGLCAEWGAEPCNQSPLQAELSALYGESREWSRLWVPCVWCGILKDFCLLTEKSFFAVKPTSLGIREPCLVDFYLVTDVWSVADKIIGIGSIPSPKPCEILARMQSTLIVFLINKLNLVSKWHFARF